jgi:hypothetical protein
MLYWDSRDIKSFKSRQYFLASLATQDFLFLGNQYYTDIQGASDSDLSPTGCNTTLQSGSVGYTNIDIPNYYFSNPGRNFAPNPYREGIVGPIKLFTDVTNEENTGLITLTVPNLHFQSVSLTLILMLTITLTLTLTLILTLGVLYG